MRTATCPRCDKTMEEGFLVDHSHGIDTQAEWVEGPPLKSFWSGVKLRGKLRRPVVAYCCPGCGFLQSYARLNAE